MNKNILAVFIIITAACNSNSTYTVHVEDGNDISAFSNSIKELELIPLSTDDTHLLGTQTDLIPTDDGFIVLDVPNSKIYHYDQSGTFINAIGRKGRGPGEYNSLLNVELVGDSLYVFSAPQKMQCFSLTGELLSEKKIPSLGRQSYIFRSDTLNYHDFSPTKKDRLSVSGRSGEKEYLHTTASVLPFNTSVSRFSSDGDSVFLIDSYSPVIYQYNNQKLSEHIRFDFGKYTIPKTFFSAGDPYKAAAVLLESDFSVINSYMETPELKIVEIMTQSNGDVKFIYGLYDKEWTWFDCSGHGEALKESFKFAVGKTIFALLDPAMLTHLKGSLILDKASDKEILKHISEKDNYVIAKIELRS